MKVMPAVLINTEAFEREDRVVRELICQIERSFWELGLRLCNIRDKKLYRARYALFDLYLRDLGLDVTKAYRLMAICRFYEAYESMLQRCNIEIRQIPWTRLAVIPPYIKHMTNFRQVKAWVKKAQKLSVRKLMRELKQGSQNADSQGPAVLQRLFKELPANVKFRGCQLKDGVGRQVEVLLAFTFPERKPELLYKLMRAMSIEFERRVSLL